MITWPSPKKILVILAHPDDPEFFCGGTISKWIKEGNSVHYLLMTHGEKGINANFNESHNIVGIREQEQLEAGKILGVESIAYLDFIDGMIVPDLKARKEVVSAIRDIMPDVVVTCDPTNYYMNGTYINHPDHRAAGQIVIDTVFPAVQNELYFPDLVEAGLQPHFIEEVWISLPKDVNTVIDVSETWADKMAALEAHKSQIGDVKEFRSRMLARAVQTDDGLLRFEEYFHRIIFRQ